MRTIGAEGFISLVTDLRLPDGYGVQAIRLLRATQPNAEAMVISALPTIAT